MPSSLDELRERLAALERDLAMTPCGISVYHDLPFAIFRYDPPDESEIRRQVRRAAAVLTGAGRRVRVVSLGTLFWNAVRQTEGVGRLAEVEREIGYPRVQQDLTSLLSDADFSPLPEMVAARSRIEPVPEVVFLVRAGALAPAAYHMSKLLDELHGRSLVPTVLFYPGRLDGVTELTFMNLPDREATGNYRVKIY